MSMGMLLANRHAPIDDEFGPGNVAGLVGGKKQDTTGDVVYGPCLTQWDRGDSCRPFLFHISAPKRHRLISHAGLNNAGVH